MCPDVLSLFSIKHQGIFLLEVKIMPRTKKASERNVKSLLQHGTWDDRKFYDFICYNRKIYNIYVSSFMAQPSISLRRIGEHTYTDVEKYKQDIENYVSNSSTATRYKNYSEACREIVSTISVDINQNGKSSYDKKFFVEGNEIVGEQALIKTIINIYKKHNIDIRGNKEMIHDLKSIASKAGTITNAKNNTYYNFKKGLSGLASNFITAHTEKFTKIGGNIDIYSTGQITYGSQNANLSKFLNLQNLDPNVAGLSGHEQKIDDLITYQSDGKTLTFSVSVKSHWSQIGTGQKLSIQGSAQTFKILFNLSSFYGVYFIKDTGYWRFLNDAFYQRNNDLLTKIEPVIYSSYFGNVDYLIEWELSAKNGEISPEVKIYTRKEIMNKIRGKFKFQAYNKINLWQNFSDSDISPNEEIILNNVAVAALNAIVLSV